MLWDRADEGRGRHGSPGHILSLASTSRVSALPFHYTCQDFKSAEPQPLHRQTFTYDAFGQLITSTDGEGKTTTYGYDHLGNTLYQSDQTGTWRYTYDRQGRMLSASDPAGGQTSFTNDYMGNRRSVSQAMGDGRTSTRTYSFDKAGNVTVEWDGENNVAVYQHDSLGRRTLERREGLNGSEAEETSFENR